MMKFKSAFSVFFIFCTLALSACGGPGVMVTDSSPPIDMVENIPLIANRTTEIWRPGYWIPKDNGSFAWIPGKIISRPYPTAVWAPARWTHHIYGWTFEEGYWQ